MPRLTFASIVSLALCVCVAHCSVAEEFTYAPLDDFEDASPWIKGDPNTDLEQKDAAVVPSTAFVKQGKQSLAFMIRVNWTPRPGEKYAKGWPMMSRGFDPPQDWSQFDRVFFWLYTETEASLPEDRVLRCAPSQMSLIVFSTLNPVGQASLGVLAQYMTRTRSAIGQVRIIRRVGICRYPFSSCSLIHFQAYRSQ